MAKIAAFLISAVIVFLGLQVFLFTAVPIGTAEHQVVFEVREGAPFGVVAAELSQLGLVRSSLGLKIFARLTGADQRIKVGEYALNKGMAPSEIVSILSSGKSITRPITFPEGMNIYEIAALIESKGLGSKDEFLSIAKDPAFIKATLGEELPSLEGYLFPETYNITKYTTVRQLMESMVQRFEQVYGEVSTTGKSDLKKHQQVILASMIEKETGAPEERPTISSVFYNRLTKGMRLQSDPTIMYGLLEEQGRAVDNITKADILSPTKFNTYVVSGLPAGPIANPGREALQAVLQPVKSDFLYFVSRNDGTHVFTEKYEDHEKAVREFQLDRKAREGKSWRDLKK